VYSNSTKCDLLMTTWITYFYFLLYLYYQLCWNPWEKHVSWSCFTFLYLFICRNCRICFLNARLYIYMHAINIFCSFYEIKKVEHNAFLMLRSCDVRQLIWQMVYFNIRIGEKQLQYNDRLGNFNINKCFLRILRKSRMYSYWLWFKTSSKYMFLTIYK